MYKRKITGILKYGKRSFKTSVTKLQEGGGFSAFSQGYDWRDDPYETMLIREQMATERAKIKSSNRGRAYAAARAGNKDKTVKMPAIGKFDTLTSGLKGSRAAANAKYQQAQNMFFEKATEDPSWVATPSGKKAFQFITNLYGTLDAELRSEKENFKEAYGQFKTREDKQTYAISADNNLLVGVKGGGSGSGEYIKKISMVEYLENPDKYVPRTINEFAEWKKSFDTSGSSRDVNEFMRAGAIGEQSLYENYFKDNEEELTNIVNKSLIQANSARVGADKHISKITNKEQFDEGIVNLIHGRDFYYKKGQEPKNLNSSAINRAIKTVYEDVLSYSKDKSILLASLKAEVLRDSRHREKLASYKTVAERAKYLGEQVQYALVSKILNKGKATKTSKELENVQETIGASGSGNPTARPGANQMITELSTTFDGNARLYNIGKEYGEGEKGYKNVSIFSTPSLPDYISNDKLGLNRDPDADPNAKHQNTLIGNTKINSITKVSVDNIYTENGMLVKDVVGDSSLTQKLISEKTVLDPNNPAGMVFLPVDKNGKLMMDQYNRLKEAKIDAKQNFINSVKKHQNTTINSSAEDLMTGNLSNTTELRDYGIWLDRGMNLDKYKDDHEADPTNKLKKASYKLAKDANAAILKMKSSAETIFPKGLQVRLEPFLQASIIFDDEKADFKDKYDEKVKEGDYASGVITALESGKPREFLQDVNDIDDFNWFSDNIYRTKVFIPMKSPALTHTQEAGAKQDQISNIQEVYEQVLRGMNDASIASNPDKANAYMILKN